MPRCFIAALAATSPMPPPSAGCVNPISSPSSRPPSSSSRRCSPTWRTRYATLTTAALAARRHRTPGPTSPLKPQEPRMSEKVLITPAELSDMVKTEPTVVIDTRDPATYAAGHLPDAVNIHDIFTYLATSTPDGVAAMREKFASTFGAAGLSGTETAVVSAQSMNTGFGQSCRGYVLLRYLGYPKVRVLHGGYAAWVAAGLPSTTTVSVPAIKTFA